MTTNKTLNVHYVGTFDDGTEFDNSRSRGAALQVEVGTGQLIPGFEQACSEMEVGETKKIRIRPEEGYGPTNPTLVQEVGKEAFPEDFEFTVGEYVSGQGENGQPVTGQIVNVEDTKVTLDFNHPMAGKNLNFEITAVES